MRKLSLVALVSILCMTFGCKDKQQAPLKEETAIVQKPPKKERPISVDNGKFFEQNGTPFLYGGEDNMQHFNIENLSLKPNQFHYGIGRERFPALLEPAFMDVPSADRIWSDTSRFLLAKAEGDMRAYSVKDLTRHEVVNDTLAGKPIMAVYCILADLGSIYSRQYGDDVLTFALSGYTYYDYEVWAGLDGFVLWDRDTESLWWPLIGEAVSGPLKGVKLQEMEKEFWEDTTWGSIKSDYPNAKVLISGQDYERPTSWPKLEDIQQIVDQFSGE